MNEDTVEQIVAVLKKFDKTDKDIGVNTDIAAELDLDSLAVMDVIMELEEKLDISIPLNLIPDIRTVGDLAETIGQLKEEV